LGVKVTTEEAERLLAACRILGDHPDEQRLLNAEISDVVLHRSGTSQTYEVRFADGSRGAFKSIEGGANSATTYGHTAASVVLNDVASWLVAKGLGYEDFLGGVVVRTCSHAGVGIGSLQTWLDGDPSGSGWEQASRLREAGLFDCVTSQQDRNNDNFNYDASTDEIGLFDQSFTFATVALRSRLAG
jgi:hypothetical protein